MAEGIEGSCSDTDLSLSAFLRARNERESENLLAALVADRLEPLTRKFLRRKLGVSLRPDDGRRSNQDALDMVSEVKTLVLAKLRRLRKRTDSDRIENLEAYVRTIALHVYSQHLRNKYPLRLRLTNQLRYLLTHHGDYSLWKTETNQWACGFAGLQHDQIGSMTEDSLVEIVDEVRSHRGKHFSAEHMNLVEFAENIFSRRKSPLLFVDLVTIAAKIKGIQDPLELSEAESIVEDPITDENNIVRRLEQADFLKRLWDKIGELPHRHRLVLLLNLKSRQNEGLIGLFPATGVASIRQIAKRLEFGAEDFAAIWNELPWDDLKIAEHLNLTRQQVINLRQSARATLKRRLRDF